MMDATATQQTTTVPAATLPTLNAVPISGGSITGNGSEMAAEIKKRASEAYAGLSHQVSTANLPVVVKSLKLINFTYAVLLLVCTIMGMMFGSFFVSLTMLFFSMLVLAFEIRDLLPYNDQVVRNFGFMFTAAGRAGFFVFVGTLAFDLPVIGVFAGIASYLLGLIQGFVIFKNPDYRNMLESAVGYQPPRASA